MDRLFAPAIKEQAVKDRFVWEGFIEQTERLPMEGSMIGKLPTHAIKHTGQVRLDIAHIVQFKLFGLWIGVPEAAPHTTTLDELFGQLRQRSVRRNPPPVHVWGFTLPSALSHFVEPIDASRAILKLESNWDAEGSPGYAEVTWRRAIHLVVESATQFWRHFRMTVPEPMIMKGPEGSIDILWTADRRELLVNVPAEPDEPIRAAGRHIDSKTTSIEASNEASDDNEWMLAWLMK